MFGFGGETGCFVCGFPREGGGQELLMLPGAGGHLALWIYFLFLRINLKLNHNLSCFVMPCFSLSVLPNLALSIPMCLYAALSSMAVMEK